MAQAQAQAQVDLHLFFHHLTTERRLDDDSRVDKKGLGSPDLGNAKPAFFTF